MTTRSVAERMWAAILGLSCAAGVVAVALAEKTTTTSLGGEARYLTHVSTDKPIYRIGESVYVRAVLLHARTHEPMGDSRRLMAMVEIKGPKGDAVASGWVPSQDSVFGFEWKVPPGQAGGEYTVKISYPGVGFAPAERKFDIRAYRAPRLKTQIVFLRDGYGPGDKVSATVHADRAEGGVPAGAKVTISARVDGAEVFSGPGSIDAHGNCTGTFELPKEIARGEGTLSFAIEDGGVVETAAKTIPILLQTVDLSIYPEGGDLVAGLATRVYLEAKTPARKPADIAGQVIDADGQLVATFRTEHEGRGRFAITPKAGGKYTLKITEPAGIKTVYTLPEVKAEGAVIRSPDDVAVKQSTIKLQVTATKGGPYRVSVSQREAEVASLMVDLQPGVPADVTLTPPSAVDGVLIATVWDRKSRPLAERLIFRQPAKSLKIEVTSDKQQYVPGEKAELTLKTLDASGQPVSAVVGVTVTDDTVLEMIEKREQSPRLPVMVFLENEVNELADAHVYLDPANAKAPLAVDLLLGTQGWRRFAIVETTKFVEQHGDKARRALAMRLVSPGEDAGIAMYGGGFGGAAPAGGPKGIRRMAAARADGGGMDDAVLEMGAAQAPVPAAAAMAEGAAEVPAEEQMQAEAPNAAVDEAPGDKLQQAMGRHEKAAAADRPFAVHRRPRSSEAEPQPGFVVVREYAHAVRPNRKAGERTDFAETLYWNAGIRTDAKTGQAKVSFSLNDSVTAFRVLADGFGADGGLAQQDAVIESIEPFYIEPKLPLEVTSGDVIQLPIGVVRGLSSALPDVRLSVEPVQGITVSPLDPFSMGTANRVRRLVKLTIGQRREPADLIVSAQAGPYKDRVTRQLLVKPLGFPIEVASGGMLDARSPGGMTIELPAELMAGSVTTNISVYPTPLANLTNALERLIQEPNGCFEQTSSTLYPLVMAQQYFTSHTGVPVALITRSREMLDKGYAKLVSFECKQKGYEWFGADPGHEALTAYGLLEFSDMSQVRTVDASMLGRTREWLLKRRDGKGGFLRDAKALDSFGGAPELTTNAYVTWALLEAGEKGLEKEVAAIRQQAESTQDAYVVALAANILALSGDQAAARKLMDRLVKHQDKSGMVAGASTSITRSGGEALNIETTSLAVLAWLRDPAYAGAVENGIKFLADSCKAGRFGSTQSTVLALRAIVTYDKARARPKVPGKVQLYVDERPVGEPIAFNADTQEAIKLPEISDRLGAGKHLVEIRMQDGSAMPYSLTVNYHATKPLSAKQCKLGLQVSLPGGELVEGAITEANVVVTNLTDAMVPMPVAIIGLPAGLEPRHDQLKELVKAERIHAYEVLGREVVLYWRAIKPAQRVELPISLTAAVPGTYTGPASRAYEYYTDEYKHWVDGLRAVIVPRNP